MIIHKRTHQFKRLAIFLLNNHFMVDILIFLPGSEEIENLAGLLRKYLSEESEVGKSFSSDVKTGEQKSNKRDMVQSIKGIGTDLHSGHGSIEMEFLFVCFMQLSHQNSKYLRFNQSLKVAPEKLF